MNQIPIEQLIWAVENKDMLAPYEREAIVEILREFFVTPPNICVSETE
jgi:hypothetical protein